MIRIKGQWHEIFDPYLHFATKLLYEQTSDCVFNNFTEFVTAESTAR